MSNRIFNPSDINSKEDFQLEMLSTREAEIVARNLVILSQARGKWISPFTESEYFAEIGQHKTTNKFVQAENKNKGLDILVRFECLNYSDNKYALTDNFYQLIAPYKLV